MHRHHPFLFSLLVAVLAGCATPPQSSTQSPALAQSPSASPASPVPGGSASLESSATLKAVTVTDAAPYEIDLTAHADDVWDRIRLGFAIPNMESPVVVEQQAWYLSHPDFLARAVERSSHYLYHVVEELEKRHMPTELALLPFVESAYNPMALSRAHASGMWQFIPSTGKNFNLKQDWWRDDRRDVVASTDAALTYLQSLYEMHGDWTLALASYNWGEGAVQRAIDRNVSRGLPTDYMSLNMPDETRAYYPRLQALKNIIANPQAFGLHLPRIDNTPYFVAVNVTRDIDVQTAARFAAMPIDEFKALNPSFNRPVISASANIALLLPADRAEAFQEHLQTSNELVNWQAYRVHRGERIERIAQRFGMSVADLCEANSINARERLKPGAELLVALHHSSASRAQPAAALEPVETIAADNAPVTGAPAIMRASFTPAAARAAAAPGLYTVHRGDTLFAIASRFHVSVDTLKHLNHLNGNALSTGATLKVAQR